VRWVLLIAILAGVLGLVLWRLNRTRQRKRRRRAAAGRVHLRNTEDALPSLVDIRLANFSARSLEEAKKRSADAAEGLLGELDQHPVAGRAPD
jgi:hypothetical protein